MIKEINQKDILSIMRKFKSLSYLLTPDVMFEKFDDITPEFLLSRGITALLIDIDNTLAPYEQPLPDERIKNYFKSLADNKIKAALVSNNNLERVELFNSELGLIAFADCGKPNSKMLLTAMKKMGSTPENTAAIGDQLLTDALGAHRLGMPAFIVPPIKDKTTTFYKIKRFIEKPYIRAYKRKLKKAKKQV